MNVISRSVALTVAVLSIASAAVAAPPVVDVEVQPLSENVKRVASALELLGTPLPAELIANLAAASEELDGKRLQRLLDSHVLFVVSINPESRVKVDRGPTKAVLQQAGFTPVLVKIVNESTVTKRLRITSPQAGAVYSGESKFSLRRQQQEELGTQQPAGRPSDRFLELAIHDQRPMTDRLSGLEAEYVVALLYSTEAGKREATVGFDVGQGNQDLGFRGEVPILFDIKPAVPAQLRIRDADGSPTMAKLLFRDAIGHVFPPQAKRLAPDLFFQPYVYRADGETVLLRPGTYSLTSSRGPEYVVQQQTVAVPSTGKATIDVKLQRWVEPAKHGFYCGDHHIHAAGCAHYTSPTEGITPADMFRQVKGEGLNVGCVLTWGPCYDHQRTFFSPEAADISEPATVLKYDLEISGFGSQALGHVCLLNLKDQTYPGSDGTSTKGWPTWTTPVMRWAKEQGGVAGYAHSASGLAIDARAASDRLIAKGDRNNDKQLSSGEVAAVLMPEPFEKIDADGSGLLTIRELAASHDRVANRLPNLAVPEMNGVGAMEICVSTAEGVCDFISAMDTPRIAEWNCWYHILNCGFPLKVSGETDFPCMSSRRVGQGRVYVQLGKPDRVDFGQWCEALAAGRSYVSDGFVHALDYRVAGQAPGTADVRLDRPDTVKVTATVAFAKDQPNTVAQGGVVPLSGRRVVGDTVLLHAARTDQRQVGGQRRVEVVVNGRVVASHDVAADGQPHDLEFTVPIEKSSWVALRQFPQLHTNPVNVVVAGKPIRASRDSALWCIETIKLLWDNRHNRITKSERPAAKAAFERAIGVYRQIASEATTD